MTLSCQFVKEPVGKNGCGLLGNADVEGSDSEGFLMAFGELVEHFQITWAISPLRGAASGEGLEAGFVLDLEGKHGPVVEHMGRACAHCTNLLLTLRIIGDWLFPPAGSCESCELRTCDNFVHLDEGGPWEPHLVKTFRLVSRVGTACHLGSCPVWCGAALIQRLNRIGSAERGKNVNFLARTESGT